MKLTHLHTARLSYQLARSCRREEGTAVIVVIALLAILLVYLAGNVRTLHSLGRELKLIEMKQTRRLEAAARGTNVLALTNASPHLNQAASQSPSLSNR